MKILSIHHKSNFCYKLVLFALLFLTITTSCKSVKPAASKSGKKYFETYYVGDEGTQYFVKPILFKNKKLDEDLRLDITFRYKDVVKDSAFVNFSINSSTMYKTIERLELSNKSTAIESSKVSQLFNEKDKKGFVSRYSTKFSLNEIKDLFDHNAWQVIVHDQRKSIKYQPIKKTKKIIKAIKNELFVLM